jgi:hypothetical protein
MRLGLGLYLAILVAPVVSAGTLDVSSQTSVVVPTGDTLVFELLTGSFGVNAAAFGLPVDPTAVSFDLVSAPLSIAGGFTAALESSDLAVSVAFGSLSYGSGFIQGSEYTGAVSTVQGYLQLSPLLSEGLFGDGSAFLTLRNTGPDVTVGLSPYTLRQDMYASLSGGPLSVGAAPGVVDLDSPGNAVSFLELGGAANFGTQSVPEPGSGGLLLGGGVLLCGLSALLARVSRGRGPALPHEKSAVCIR